MERKPILAKKFIEALTETGLLPPWTTRVKIEAKIGEPVQIEYEVYGDERLLEIAPGIVEPNEGEEPGVAK